MQIRRGIESISGEWGCADWQFGIGKKYPNILCVKEELGTDYFDQKSTGKCSGLQHYKKAKLNGSNSYYYLKYLLEEIPEFMCEEGENTAKGLKVLLPWSDSLSTECHKKRR